MDGLLAKFTTIVSEEKLVASGDVMVVAVSGGPDSMVLLHLLHQLKSTFALKLIIAHVNHQFRGRESDLEAETVKSFAEQLGLQFEVGEMNVPAYIEETGLNSQVAAREMRYAFLHKVASQYGASKIMLAHHADDQAETVLMRVLRGAGAHGLTGIPMRRFEKKVELIRPLLRIYKSEIISYLMSHKLPYCIDSSNSTRKYLRNRIRLDVLPYLKEFNPQLPQSLNRMADTLAAEDDYIEIETQRIFEQRVKKEEGMYYLAGEDFKLLHVALQRRLIKLILSYLAPSSESIDYLKVEAVREAMMREYPSSLRLDLVHPIAYMKAYDQHRFGAFAPVSYQNYEHTLISVPCRLEIRERSITLSLTQCDDVSLEPHSKWEAVFDAECIVWPLTVRNRMPGDRIAVIGLNGTKKVKDIFIDEKMSPALREQIPIILDGNHNILWLPGLRRSKYAPVSSKTKQVLHIQMSLSVVEM